MKEGDCLTSFLTQPEILRLGILRTVEDESGKCSLKDKSSTKTHHPLFCRDSCGVCRWSWWTDCSLTSVELGG